MSALQAALSTFQTQIATAQSSHNTTASVLGNHAGFDANGKVTNPDQARQTLLDGRQSLRDAHGVIRQAVEKICIAQSVIGAHRTASRFNPLHPNHSRPTAEVDRNRSASPVLPNKS